MSAQTIVLAMSLSLVVRILTREACPRRRDATPRPAAVQPGRRRVAWTRPHALPAPASPGGRRPRSQGYFSCTSSSRDHRDPFYPAGLGERWEIHERRRRMWPAAPPRRASARARPATAALARAIPI